MQKNSTNRCNKFNDCEKLFGPKQGAWDSLRHFQCFYHHPHYLAEIPVPAGNSCIKKQTSGTCLNFSETVLSIPRIIFKANYANVRIGNEECNKVRMRIDLRSNYSGWTDLAFHVKALCFWNSSRGFFQINLLSNPMRKLRTS